MCPVISNVNAITDLHLNYMYTDYSIFAHSLIGTKDFTWKKWLSFLSKQKSTWHKVSKECT